MKKIYLIFLFLSCVLINFSDVRNVLAEETYVTSIKIDGENIDGFSSDNTGPYTIDVDSNKSSIIIGYVFASGYNPGQCNLGSVSLNYGLNEFKCEVTKEGNESKVYQLNINRKDNRSSDNSLTSLMIGSNKVLLTDTDTYDVSVTSDTVEVKATPANGATLVDGYGERIGTNALKLTGESTSIEIKVKAENGDLRTYKINIHKKDYKSNDATLKSLTIEDVNFDFKNDVYEYNLSVKYEISKIKITAVKNQENATLEYQENVVLKNGINKIDIKVIAEDGTTKTYTLNITREEQIPIVSTIEIEGIDFKFDSKIYNYKIETSLLNLNFKITLRNDEAKYEIKNNENLKNGSTIKIIATDANEEVTYSFKIINKEDIEKKETKENKDESINNKDDFWKKNEMLIALIIFGIGTFSLLISILLKKGSVK